MTRRLASVVMVLSIVAGAVVVLAPGAGATKITETWKSTTKELKGECADGGGTFFGSSSGKVGVCVWEDGSMSTCSDKRKGNNCNTQERVITPEGEFVDFLTVALGDPPSLTVVPGDGTPADGRKRIRRLLDKEEFKMTAERLEAACTNVNADLITLADDARAVCLGGLATIFCDTQEDGKNCTIEAVKKSTRRWLQLLRRALVDPSSVTIVVDQSGGAPSPTSGGEPSTTTTEPPTTTTTGPTTTTSQEPDFL